MPNLTELKPLPLNTDKSRWSKTLKSYKYDLVSNTLQSIDWISPTQNISGLDACQTIPSSVDKDDSVALSNTIPVTATYLDGSVDTHVKNVKISSYEAGKGASYLGKIQTINLIVSEDGTSKTVAIPARLVPTIKGWPEATFNNYDARPLPEVLGIVPVGTYDTQPAALVASSGSGDARFNLGNANNTTLKSINDETLACLHDMLLNGCMGGLAHGMYLDIPNFTLAGNNNHALQRVEIAAFNPYQKFQMGANIRNPDPHVVWAFKYLQYESPYYMNPTDTNDGGYRACSMRTFVDAETYTEGTNSHWKTALRKRLDERYLMPLKRWSDDGGTGTGENYKARDTFTEFEALVWLPTVTEYFGVNPREINEWFTNEAAGGVTRFRPFPLYADGQTGAQPRRAKDRGQDSRANDPFQLPEASIWLSTSYSMVTYTSIENVYGPYPAPAYIIIRNQNPYNYLPYNPLNTSISLAPCFCTK
jgi:hypothetical protein